MLFGTGTNAGVSERMRITSTGNIGINTNSPQSGLGSGLTIDGASYAPLYLSNSGTQRGYFTGYSGGLIINASTGTLSLNNGGANVGVGITVPLTKLHVAGASPGVRIDATTGADPRLSFYDNGVEKFDIFVTSGQLRTYSGVYGNYVQTIFTSGNIAISSTTDNGYRFYVSGTIYATGNITANSDLTLKKNLTIIDNPTDKLMQLNGYAYQWKSDDSHQYGVIAQEVEKILPYAVSTGNDGIKGVSYNQIIPVLIEAVKEQKKELEELRDILASK
jgi:hypothetical protein